MPLGCDGSNGGFEYRRAPATIQLGRTLRGLNRLYESEALLKAELEQHLEPGNAATLHNEARTILALTYLAQGRATEAAGLALTGPRTTAVPVWPYYRGPCRVHRYVLAIDITHRKDRPR